LPLRWPIEYCLAWCLRWRGVNVATDMRNLPPNNLNLAPGVRVFYNKYTNNNHLCLLCCVTRFFLVSIIISWWLFLLSLRGPESRQKWRTMATLNPPPSAIRYHRSSFRHSHSIVDT
jgi:hypothetical protein